MDSDSDVSNLSGILNFDQKAEEEATCMASPGQSTTGSESTIRGEQVITPLIVERPQSLRSAQAPLGRDREKKYVNITATLEENDKLKKQNYDLKLSIQELNDDLPYLLHEGKDHLAQYINNRRELARLRPELRDALHALEQEQSDRERERDTFEARIHNLQQEVMRAQQAAAVAEAAEGPMDGDSSCASNVSVTSSIGQVRRERENFERRLESEHSENYRLEQEVNELKSKLARAEAELQVAKARMMAEETKQRDARAPAGTDASTTDINVQSETFHVGHSNDQALVAEYRQQIDTLEVTLAASRATEASLIAAVKQLSSEVKDLQQIKMRVDAETTTLGDLGGVTGLLSALVRLEEMNKGLQGTIRKEVQGRVRAKPQGTTEAGDDKPSDEEVPEGSEETKAADIAHQMTAMIHDLKARVEDLNQSKLDASSFRAGMARFDVTGANSTHASPRCFGLPRTTFSPRANMSRSILNQSTTNMLNRSLNAVAGVKNAKENLMKLEEACTRMFDRLKASADLFEEIREALGQTADTSLVARIHALKMDFDASIRMDGEGATAALVVVEQSMNELGNALEDSIFQMAGQEGGSLLLHLDEMRTNEETRRLTEGRTFTLDRSSSTAHAIGDITAEGAPLASSQRLFEHSGDAALHALQMELDEKSSELETVRVSLAEATERIMDMERDLVEAQNARDASEARNEVLERTVKDAMQQGKTLKEHLETSSENHRDTVAGYEKQIKEMENEMTENHREVVAGYEKKIEEMENERSLLQKSEEELNGRVLDLTESVAELQSKLAEHKDRVKLEVASKESAERTASRLKTELESVEDERRSTQERYIRVSEDLDEERMKRRELENKQILFSRSGINNAVEEELERRRRTTSMQRQTQTVVGHEQMEEMTRKATELEGALATLGRAVTTNLQKGLGSAGRARECRVDDVPRLVALIADAADCASARDAELGRLNGKLAGFLDARDEAARCAALEKSISGSDESDTNAKENQPPATGGKVKAAKTGATFSSPNRQLFLGLTTQSHDLVQKLKEAQLAVTKGRPATETNSLLVAAIESGRTLRAALNERLVATTAPVGDSGSAEMVLELVSLKEENTRLRAQLSQVQKRWKAVAGHINRPDLVEKISREMVEIGETMKTVAALSSGSRSNKQ